MAHRFSEQEMGRRLGLARGFMETEELDALVLFGMRGRQAGVRWLSQYEDIHTCYLVVPREEEPSLLVAFFNHVPNASEVSSLPAMWVGDRPADTIAERLTAVGAKRVGLVGGGLGTGMPYTHYLALSELMPDLELADTTPGYMRLLLVKSREELDRMRVAAALTDLALEAIVKHARPGVTEVELVANAELAYRLRGGRVGITFMRSMPMDAPTGCVPAQLPSSRRLAIGDVIVTELSATSAGYSGQVLWPVFVGAEPSDEWQRLFDVGLEVYRALERTVRHGANVVDAIEAAAPIGRAGYEIYDDLLHGMGLGLSPPFIDPADMEHPPKDGGMRFERGMTIVLQPNPITKDQRMGMQLGALGVVGDDGVECLHAIPSAPLVAG